MFSVIRFVGLMPATVFCLTSGLPFLSQAAESVHSGSTMGTSYRIVAVTTGDELTAPELLEGLSRVLERIEDQMSTWRPESELSRFNRSESQEWFAVSGETATVVQEALRIAKLSDGAFDPTVGPLVRLWTFNESKEQPRIPSDAEIAAAKLRTGWQFVEVRMEPPSLRKSRSDIELDLSAIAKGYAVDAVSEFLTGRGLKSHLVEIGGEMRGEGVKTDGSPWRAGIQTPDAAPGIVYEALPLTQLSLATSGDYRNYFEIDGHRYSHTIDPQTGRPVSHTVASVSVTAQTCMLADALATAINVMGAESGLKLADQNGAAAFVLLREGAGFREASTKSFAALAVKQGGTAADEASSHPLVRTLIATLIVFGIAICGMAVGVIFSNRCITGSCGGLANMPGADGRSPCELCTKPFEQCERKMAEQTARAAGESESAFDA